MSTPPGPVTRVTARLRGARAAGIVAVPLVVALVGTAAAGTARIRVHSGDTLSQLAAGHHTTVSVLLRLNHLRDPDVIVVGQTLLIPAAAPAPALRTAPPAKPEPTTRIVTYVVRSGDNLTAIVARYKVAMDSVSTRNHLRRDGMIFIGQRLHIEVPVPVKKAPTSFAGRTYPPATLAAAARHRTALLEQAQPSKAQTRALITRTAKEQGLDPALALAIGWQESGFQQRVVSPADAIGVMQVVPSTGDYISTYLVHRKLDLLDPADNITAGVALLVALTRATTVDKAVAGYYQGIESVMAKGMYADTQSYVSSVLHLRTVFRR